MEECERHSGNCRIDAAVIEQEVISNLKDDYMAKPPRGVVGMLANQFAKPSS